MPRSRLLAVAVAGALVLPGLAACRDLPAVAASVGDARITHAQAEAMVNMTATGTPAAPGQPVVHRREMRAARGLSTVVRDAMRKCQVGVNRRYERFPVLPPIQFTLAGGRVATFVLLSLEPVGPPAVVDRT